MGGRKVLPNRQDAVFADQTKYLDEKRDERHQIYDAQQPQEQPPRDRKRGGFERIAPQQPRDLGESIPTARDESVDRLRRRGESGDSLVRPKKSAAPRRASACPKDRFSRVVDRAVCFDELNRRSKIGKWYLRELAYNVLIRLVIDAIAGRFSPTCDPAPTELASTVVDE